MKSFSIETIKAYTNDLNQWLELLSKKKIMLDFHENIPYLVEITGTSLNNSPYHPQPQLTFEKNLLQSIHWVQRIWSSLAPATRNRKAATLRSFLGWLAQEGLTTEDLSFLVFCPKAPSKLPLFLSVDEILTLLKTLQQAVNSASPDQSPKITKEYGLILLLYGGGLRVSEACHIKKEDVHFSQNRILILGKGQKQRWVALPPLCIHWIQKLTTDPPYIWGRQPLSRTLAYRIVKKWGEKSRLLKPLHPHALRHSYATHMLTSGTNLRSLQLLLGHQTLVSTQRYTHLSLNDLTQTLNDFHPLKQKSKGS